MRPSTAVLVTTLVMILAGCDQPPGAGTENHPCAVWPAPCADGLRCNDSNTCVACGDIDQVCCSTTHGLTCDSGLACNRGDGDEMGTCTDSCGLPGIACCPDYDCAAGSCVNGVCEGQPIDPCFSGSIPHTVLVLDESCAGVTTVFMTDTDQQAEDCRQKLVDAADALEEVCPLDTSATTTAVCKDGTGAYYFDHCSPEHLAVCEAHFCDTCQWTETTSTCPNGF